MLTAARRFTASRTTATTSSHTGPLCESSVCRVTASGSPFSGPSGRTSWDTFGGHRADGLRHTSSSTLPGQVPKAAALPP